MNHILPEDVVHLSCPRCGVGSDRIEQTQFRYDGLLGDFNPNRATCLHCEHRGNVGDWYLIAFLRQLGTEQWKREGKHAKKAQRRRIRVQLQLALERGDSYAASTLQHQLLSLIRREKGLSSG